ncbi:glutathione S-transferase family protein [soil metagenome]
MELFAHPFSSYCQKALIALYEHEVPFRFRLLTPMDPATLEARRALWPLAKMPVLHDGNRVLVEASIIVEYVDQKHDGAQRLVPVDPVRALEVRMLDRVFDNYVMTPVQKIVGDRLRRDDAVRDPHGVTEARALLQASYRWLDTRIAGHEWIAGGFSLADCAAAPSLFYAEWVEPIPADCAALRAYRARLLARPSMARCVEEAREFRPFFPGGAPDQD